MRHRIHVKQRCLEQRASVLHSYPLGLVKSNHAQMHWAKGRKEKHKASNQLQTSGQKCENCNLQAKHSQLEGKYHNCQLIQFYHHVSSKTNQMPHPSPTKWGGVHTLPCKRPTCRRRCTGITTNMPTINIASRYNGRRNPQIAYHLTIYRIRYLKDH